MKDFIEFMKMLIIAALMLVGFLAIVYSPLILLLLIFGKG